MSEFCEHSKCDFNNRLEYCPVEAGREGGAAVVVIDAMDAILYEGEHVSGNHYQLTSDNSEQLLHRSFSYLHGDTEGWVWPLTETQMNIGHRTDRQTGAESYAVEVSWQVHQQGATDDRFVVRYYIDSYPEGDVQAMIEEPNVVTGERESRLMTEYDYETLFNELHMVDRMHTAERSDNARVQ